jgi:hypothetical protein
MIGVGLAWAVTQAMADWQTFTRAEAVKGKMNPSVAGSVQARPEQSRQRRGQAEAKCNPRDEEEKEHRGASIFSPFSMVMILESLACEMNRNCNTRNNRETTGDPARMPHA